MSCFKWKTVCMITSSIKTIYQASLDVILAAIIYFLGKIPWRRKWQATPALLPGKLHGWRSLIGYSPWGRKESDATEWLHFTSLHVDMHFNSLGYTLRSGIAGSYGNSMFNLLRNYQTVHHRNGTILHSK